MTLSKWFLLLSVAYMNLTPQLALAASSDSLSVPIPLPAGLHFRDDYLAGWTGEERVPVDLRNDARRYFIVAAGLAKTEQEATTILQSIKKEQLRPGYPWAVHSLEIGLASADLEGIVLVVGLFKDKETAAKYRPKVGVDLQVLELATPDEMTKRDQARQAACSKKNDTAEETVSCFPGSPVGVVQIDAPSAVAAYDASYFDRHTPKTKNASTPQPICFVKPGSIFLFDNASLYSQMRDAAPVRCGKNLAFVDWTSTRLETVVAEVKGGKYLIHQVIEALCDIPAYLHSYYDHTGRRTPVGEELAKKMKNTNADCG